MSDFLLGFVLGAIVVWASPKAFDFVGLMAAKIKDRIGK